jgi:hypothetical protein
LYSFAENPKKFECDIATLCGGFFLQFPRKFNAPIPHMHARYGAERSTGPTLPKQEVGVLLFGNLS